MKSYSINAKTFEIKNTFLVGWALAIIVPLSVLWPYFFDFGKIANIENTAYILLPLVKYAGQLLQGSVPFWSFDVGIGSPWPIPFGMTHTPFIYLFNYLPPMAVLGITLFAHGMLAFWSILRIGKHLGLLFQFQALAGFSFFYTGSLEYLFWGDAPEIFLNWCLVPVIFLFLLELMKAKTQSLSLVWAIGLGYAVGYGALNGHVGIFSIYLFSIGISFLFFPYNKKQVLSYLILACLIFIFIFSDKLLFYMNEANLFSEFIVRQHNEDESIAYVFWNIFLKPFPLALGVETSGSWSQSLVELYSHSRTVGFGTVLFIFAVIMVVRMFRKMSIEEFPKIFVSIAVGFAVTFMVFFLPDNLLPDAISSFKVFRGPANFFGILLGCYGLQRFFINFQNRKNIILRNSAMLLISIHAVQVVSAAQPFIIGPILFPQSSFHSMKELNSLISDPDEFPYLNFFRNGTKESYPPRVVLTGQAFLDARKNRLNSAGLVNNSGLFAGVREVSAVLKGTSLDQIHPAQSKPYGAITGDDLMDWLIVKNTNSWPMNDQPMISLLGIDYVVDVSGEIPGAEFLEKVFSIPTEQGEISIFRNNGVWPNGIEVTEYNIDQNLPKKWNCLYPHLTCLDLRTLQFENNLLKNEATIDFGDNKITVTMVPNPKGREFLISTMFRPEWRVTNEEFVTLTDWNGLIRLSVPANVNKVILEYSPLHQMILRYLTLFLLISLPLLVTWVVLLEKRRGL